MRCSIFIFLLSFYNLSLGQALFSDRAQEAGISNLGFSYGVSVADFDNDGDEDLYVARQDDSNLLYENQGDGTFVDVASTAGVDYAGQTYMAIWGDLDNDGDPDLYLGNAQEEPNKLYRNEGNGQFSDITEQAGVGSMRKSRTVLFADVDNDGWLDLYLANRVDENNLFHNNGDGTFTDIIETSNAKDRGIAMGAIFFDFDNDNDQDLYLTHDNYQANILYRNDGNNKFVDVSEAAGVNYEGLGMGVDAGDFNNDGYTDLYITNMLENVLYLNKGDGTFEDISLSANVDDDGMGWGTTWIDYNNDGLLDLYLSNDSDFLPNPNILYKNLGDLTFSNVSTGTPLESTFEGYATACADFNDDGKPDLVVANRNSPNQLFINEEESNNFLKVRLIGVQSNASAIGAKVEVHLSNKILRDEVTSGSGYSSQNSLTLHFGLGNEARVEKVIVNWPSGHVDTFFDLESNKSYAVKEDLWLRSKEDSNLDPGFEDISQTAGIDLIGRNNGVAFGDYDGDGDDDIYVSRLQDYKNLLFENQGKGNFREVSTIAGVAYDGITVTSVWGDINNDGFQDLYLGNDREPDKLYLNNGDGSFSDITADARIINNLKPNSVNMADINNDGYLDIYVHNIFGENKLWRNNGDNTFTDIILSSGAVDTNVAMGAVFFDYDNDNDQDLLLTNDGLTKYVMYQNDGTGKFTDVSEESGLNYPGQGMGTDVADYNNDGFLDVYVTNLNENVLFMNMGDGTFTNVSEEAGIGDLGMGWGIVWIDYNNDGNQDIYMVNDSNFSPFSNKLYHNKGNGGFIEISQESPLYSFYGGYGAATSDIDLDGSLDIFLANLNGIGNQLFLNSTQDKSWIKIRLKGTDSNRDGIGARVTIMIAGKEYIQEVKAGSSYASQSSRTLHFGLADADQVDEIRVRWPNGLIDTYANQEVNQYVEISEGGEIIPVEIVTGIDDNLADINRLNVYPNPFRDQLTFEIPISGTENVNLSIYDLTGKEITELLKNEMINGAQQLIWNSSELRSGIYVVRMEINGKSVSRTLVKD